MPRFGFLGGQSVYGLVVQWEKGAFINNLGALARRGIAKETLERILAKGGSDGLWHTPPGCIEMRDAEEWLDRWREARFILWPDRGKSTTG